MGPYIWFTRLIPQIGHPKIPSQQGRNRLVSTTSWAVSVQCCLLPVVTSGKIKWMYLGTKYMNPGGKIKNWQFQERSHIPPFTGSSENHHRLKSAKRWEGIWQRGSTSRTWSYDREWEQVLFLFCWISSGESKLQCHGLKELSDIPHHVGYHHVFKLLACSIWMAGTGTWKSWFLNVSKRKTRPEPS